MTTLAPCLLQKRFEYDLVIRFGKPSDGAHCFDHLGHAQRERGRRTACERRRDRASRRVEGDDARLAIECDGRVGQACNKGIEQLFGGIRCACGRRGCALLAASSERPSASDLHR